MRNGFRVIDTDCHQMEPPTLWLDHIDPVFRDRAPQRHRAIQAFERRIGLTPHGVMGPLADSTSGMWPATREILFASLFSTLKDHGHEIDVTMGSASVTAVRVGKVKG